MKTLLITTLLFCLTACAEDSGEDEQTLPSNDNSTQSTTTTGLCIFTPGAEGGFVNLGEFTGAPEETEELARQKLDYFVASCNGDVIFNIDSHDTVDSNNEEVQ